MASTTPSGLPYPELPDDNNPPADFLALALAIESIMQKRVANIAALPPAPDFKGQRIYVEDIDVLVWYDDKTSAWQGYWRSYVPTVAGTTAPTSNCFYKINEGGLVDVIIDLTLTATITATFTCSLPTNEHANYASGPSVYPGSVLVRDTSVAGTARVVTTPAKNGAGTFLLLFPLTTATSQNVGVGGGANVPLAAAFAAGDTIVGGLSYRRESS